MTNLIARVISRTESEEGDSPRLLVLFKQANNAPLNDNSYFSDRVTITDTNGYKPGDEFDVVFTKRERPGLPASTF